MMIFLYNIGYFFLEVLRIVRRNLLSNLLSILGSALILFLLGMVLTGGRIGDRIITMLTEEAEISAYYEKDLTTEEVGALMDAIKRLNGVWDARMIDESQAKSRMEKILQEEAHILELFDDNPFEAFIEVRIQLQEMDVVLNRIGNMKGITYVRDNREVLDRLQGIIEGLKLMGFIVIMAVGITTVIILSHIIRQGIHHSRNQIITLRLLGAPEGFIGFPFVLSGLLLTLVGGMLATGGLIYLVSKGYQGIGGVLLFLPMPSKKELIDGIILVLPVISIFLGFLGSMFGIMSIRKGN